MQSNTNISIEEYKDKNREEWDNFVANSNNGTIFHLQSFLNYHEEGKFKFSNYIIRDNGKIIAVLPGGYKENGKIYWSPLGASYGSLVTGNINYRLAQSVVDGMINYFRQNGTKEIFMIPPPVIYNKIFNQNIEYALLYRKFDFEYHYISHVADLSNSYIENYSNKVRYKIKKIKKNKDIKIELTNNFKAFYPILIDNKLKHNSVPTHSLNDLYKLNELLPEKLKLFIAYYKDTPIAGSLLFLANSEVSLCFYNMMDYKYNKFSPAYYLTEHIINWSRENSYKWFDFGVSQDTASDNPMTPSLSLIDFKENFKTRGIFRSTFHLQIND